MRRRASISWVYAFDGHMQGLGYAGVAAVRRRCGCAGWRGWGVVGGGHEGGGRENARRAPWALVRGGGVPGVDGFGGRRGRGHVYLWAVSLAPVGWAGNQALKPGAWTGPWAMGPPGAEAAAEAA